MFEKDFYHTADAAEGPPPQGGAYVSQIFLHQAGEKDALAEIVQLPVPALFVHDAIMVFGQAGLLALRQCMLMPGNELAEKLPGLAPASHTLAVLEQQDRKKPRRSASAGRMAIPCPGRKEGVTLPW